MTASVYNFHIGNMKLTYRFLFSVLYLQTVFALKVRVNPLSEEESKFNDDDTPYEWENKKNKNSMPFLKRQKTEAKEKTVQMEEIFTTEAPQMHPNEMIFPLIYKQKNINSMFKYGDVWYTWAVEKRTDSSTVVNYYVCNDEPKRCDELGWDSVDALPKCAFQIEALLPGDKACIKLFGVETAISSACNSVDQLKISDMVKACGPRIRSFWRFNRVGKRPPNMAKPADINSMFCEDEEECYLNMEYRIHHDRITYSIHEPTRGHTFKSVLKRSIRNEEKNTVSETKPKERTKLSRKENNPNSKPKTKGNLKRTKTAPKEYQRKRHNKNAIKRYEEESIETSE